MNNEKIRALVATIIEGNNYKTIEDISKIINIIEKNPNNVSISKEYVENYAKKLLM